MFSQLLSTIKVKIVDKTMQIANLCVISHVKHKKLSCPAVLTWFLLAYDMFLTCLRGFTNPLFCNSKKRLEQKENQTKFRKMTRKPRSHVRISTCRTWAILGKIQDGGQIATIVGDVTGPQQRHHPQNIPHLVEKIKGFPLKAKSFRNTETYQKSGREGLPPCFLICCNISKRFCLQ